MSKQTAVEWLEKVIYRDLVYDNNVKWIIDKAKQMEKAHMLKLWEAAMECNESGGPNFEQYIEQTYGGDHD